MWGYTDCNGYYENSKDFIARGYEDRSGYHEDIEDHTTQDKDHRWPGPDPLAYLHEENRHGPSKLDRHEKMQMNRGSGFLPAQLMAQCL